MRKILEFTLVLFIIAMFPVSHAHANGFKVPFQSFTVGSSGGNISSGNLNIHYPSGDFVNGTKIVLSPVLTQFLPEYVPGITEAFSISVGSTGPLNSQDYTLPHLIKISVTGSNLSYIYIWDAVRIRWYPLDNLNKSNGIISGQSLMRGGTFIVTNSKISSQFASSSVINPSINNVSSFSLYHGLGMFFVYLAIIIVIIIVLLIIFKFKK